MEFLIIIPILIILGYSPHLYLSNRTKPIDHLKYPVLSRAHRIIRYRNVRAREREHAELLGRTNSYIRQIEAKAKEDSEKNLKEVRHRHTTESTAWDREWSVLIAPELAAKQAAAEAAAREIRRQEAEKRGREYREELERREALGNFWAIQPGEDYEDSSYGDRIVSVHSVNLRTKPNPQSTKIGVRSQHEKVSVDAWTVGEEHYGNNVWFRLKATDNQKSGWVWSGSLNNQSTSGLQNLPQPKPNTSLSFDKIHAGTITSDRIYVGNVDTMSKGGLTAPRETVYDIDIHKSSPVTLAEVTNYIAARSRYANSIAKY